MRPWGGSVLKNDAARRWCSALIAGGSTATVHQALRTVIDLAPGERVHGKEGAEALAAAEVVAAAAGRIESPQDLPDGALAWIAERPQLGDRSTRKLAGAAVRRVTGEHSDLADEWSRKRERDGWQVATDALLRRLDP